MKLLTTWERDGGGWRERMLWVANAPEAGSAEAQEHDEVIKSLRNPLRFGTKELKYLEENQDSLSSKEKRLFADAAGYFFSLAQNRGTKSLPPFMLERIERSSLFYILPKKLRDQIGNALNHQMQELIDFTQSDLDNANATKVARATLLYRRLRGRSRGNKELEVVFEKLRTSLVDWSINSLREAAVSTQVTETLEGIESRSARAKKLSKGDKILIADIYHMFPDSSSWVDHCDKESARKYALEAFSALKENPADPAAVLSWNIAEEWMSDPSHEMYQDMSSVIGRELLDSQFGKLRAVELLQFTKSQRVFLPAHLRALKSLYGDSEFLPEKMQKAEWEPQNEKLDELRKEHRKNQQIQRGLQVKGVNKYFEAGSEEARKSVLEGWKKENAAVDVAELTANFEAYTEANEEQENLVNDVWNNKLQGWINDLKTEWSKDTGVAAGFDRKIADETEGSSKQDSLKSTKEHLEKKIGDLDDLSDIDSLEKKEKFLSDFPRIVNEVISVDKDPATKENLEGITEIFSSEFLRNFNHKKQDIEKLVANFPISKNKQEEWKQVSEKIKSLEEDIVKEVEENDMFLQWGDIYNDPEKFVEKAKSDFWDDLNSRVKDRQIHAADFDILWSGEFDEDVANELDDVPEKEKVLEFREAFRQIIPGLFDGVAPPLEDRYDLWYIALDEKLSYENILSSLRDINYELGDKFQQPQQLSQLIEGAISSFREEIFAEVSDEVSEDKRDEFYAGWDRLHGRLSDNIADPSKIHVEHVNYEREKQDTSNLLQQEQEKNLAMIDELREKAKANPEKALLLNAEADRLAEAWEVRKKWYRSGGRMSALLENGETRVFWAPGKDVLSELRLQTRGVQKEINIITNDRLRAPIAALKKQYVDLQKEPNESDRQIMSKKLGDQLRNIFGSWTGNKNKIAKLMKDHRSIMEQVLPEDDLAYVFADEVFDIAGGWLEKIDGEIFDWKKEAESSNYTYTGQEPCWEKISASTQGFENVIDFDKGQYQQESKNLDSYLEKDTGAVEFLDSGNFFEDSSVDKSDFKSIYEEHSDKYRKSFSDYEKSFGSVRSKLEGDMNKLSDDEFTAKYGMMDKDYMRELISSHDRQLGIFRTGASKFLKPSFYNSWLRKYNESGESRANALEEMGQFQGLADWTTEAKNQAVDMKTWIDEWEPGTGKNIRQYQRFSLYDIYALVVQAVEVNKRRWERKSERAVAKIGVGFFGRKSNWGKEFYRKSQETEEARVKEIEGEIDEDPWWDIQQQLYESNDPDEAKACINKLIEKGVFKWDDPELWKTLMRLSGNAVNFSASDHNKDISEILGKCRDACEFIWSREVFRSWDNSLESKTKAQEDNFEAEFNRYEHMKGMREKILENMLDKWARGDRSNTDPARYGKFLRLAFIKGKMNGGPMGDSRWFYTIMGVKYGLLSRDFLNRVNDEMLPNMPYFDFFTDKSQAKKNGKLVPEGTPGSHEGGWTYEDYMGWADFLGKGSEGKFDVDSARKNNKEFFYDYIYQSEEARGRVERMIRNGSKSFDHDDGAMFVAGLGEENVTKMLNTTSTDEDKYTPDFWRAVLSGYQLYFEGIAGYIKRGDDEYGLDNEGWQKMRERNLVEVEDRMKAMLIVIHSLAGNLNLNERKPIMFSQADFEKEETYSPSANKSCDQIHNVLNDLLDISGKRAEFGDLNDKNTWHKRKGTAPPAKNEVNAKQLEERKAKGTKLEIHNKIYDLIKGTGGHDVFTTKNIDKLLQKIANGGKAVDMFGGGQMGLAA